MVPVTALLITAVDDVNELMVVKSGMPTPSTMYPLAKPAVDAIPVMVPEPAVTVPVVLMMPTRLPLSIMWLMRDLPPVAVDVPTYG